MNSVIVTGVAGFIGSNLANKLLDQGCQVVGIDQFNDYYDPALKRKNISAIANNPEFQLIDQDIRSLDLSTLLMNVEVIYHQAAQAGVRASWGSTFHDYTERNIDTTQMLLEAAKGAKHLKRFIFASTSSIYGDAESLPTSELICPKPVSPYGVTKLAAEQLCLMYHKNFEVPVTALRYFSVYGPHQRPDMAFHKFYKAVLSASPIPIYGDGLQTRDYTFVSDIVDANIAAAVCPEAVGEIFNIGGGSRVSLLDVIQTMERIVGQPILRDHIEKALGDARHTGADISKAQALLGYRAQVSLVEGLTREWEWIQELYGSGQTF